MKKFIVVKSKTHPWDLKATDYNIDMWFLKDIKTKEIVSVLEEKDFIKEGEILTEKQVKFTFQNKKSKHLVEGDKVIFRLDPDSMQLFEGTIKEIVEDKEEYWDDIFVLVDCSNPTDIYKEIIVPVKNKVKRSNAEAKSWLYAEITDPYLSEKVYTQRQVDDIISNLK